jgi:hypothetical protein
MEAISDWIDYKLTRAAHKLDKKYKIEQRVARFEKKMDKKLENNPNLIWQIALGSAGVWIAGLVLFALVCIWIF